MTDSNLWPGRISSFSGQNGSCVEIADDGNSIHIRNSNHPDAGTISVPRDVFGDWLAGIKAGEFDDLA